MLSMNHSFMEHTSRMPTEDFLKEHDTFGLTEQELQDLVVCSSLYVKDLEESEIKHELAGLFIAGFIFARYYERNKDFSQLLPQD